MQIQLLLQTLILPLLLSFAVYRAAPKDTQWQTAGLFFAWLAACFWILNIPVWPPAEAADGLWLAGLGFVAMSFPPAAYAKAGQLSALLLALLFISWPLLEYALSPELVLELLLLLMAGGLLVLVKSSAPAPALILSMSATALALCTALAGSLLIAQLAGALAAAAGVFAIVELGGRLHAPALPVSRLLPLALLYFLLLAIARFYADLSTGPALLLLLAPLSLRLPHRLAPGVCLLMLVSAAVWIFMLQDSNGYY